MGYPYIMKDSFISITIAGKPYNIHSSHENFNGAVAAIREERWDDILPLIDIQPEINEYGEGVVIAEHGIITYNGTPIHNTLSNRILRMKDEGFNINPMLNFLNNLMKNPSYRAVNELYDFMEAGDLPITDDGHFLAYKRVNGKYRDIHSDTFDNSIGSICQMERNRVDEDKNRTCSAGLHFCSISYLPSYGRWHTGNHVMIIKINPRDVVAIPADYNNAKGRCCRYEVIGEHILDDTTAFCEDSVVDLKKHPNGVPAKSRKEEAIDLIVDVVSSVIEEADIDGNVDDLVEFINEQRNDAVEKIEKVMEITRKSASEYFRKLKKDVAERLKNN